MPVLGIIASANQGGRTTAVGSYDALATAIVPSGGLASITFAGIPTGYKHLQIRSVLVNTAGASGNYAAMQFNGDTSASYSWHLISGNGSAFSTNNLSSTTSIRYDQGLYSSNSNTAPQMTVCDILDYAVSTKNKTTRALDGGDANGAGFMSIVGGGWYNTAAINNITIFSFSGGSPSTFGQFSHIALYGVK
jgi:hypothetical protein